ncbi:hypothetical protein HELRODRAFT_193504 [Helobdella robusta]|uniref:Protein kinase domain-containing protein n=1 Tax=Helobdella robusta TaxID=6412 RepID=T1FV24_HELRO|nr:hypothetical protein HELRODRAFT_193504 [Helobdella robusta]ESN95701.1 hypothetical protein HELRODRAFT_193504 [Helobdella robusta]
MGAGSSKKIDLITQIPLSGQENNEKLVPWLLYNANVSDESDGFVTESVSIFDYVDDPNSRNACLILKTLRHPNIIQLHKYHSTPTITATTVLNNAYNDHQNTCYLVTEPLTPLVNCISNLNIHEILAGIFDVMSALKFLHYNAKIIHNNVATLSVFIGSDHAWKLGCFERATSSNSVATTATAAAATTNTAKQQTAKCEVFAPDRDGFVAFIEEIADLDYFNLNENNVNILKEVVEEIKNRATSGDDDVNDDVIDDSYPCNEHCSHFLNSTNILNKSDFVQILSFLKFIVLKSKEEKKEFFNSHCCYIVKKINFVATRSLVPKLQALPEELVTKRLLPLLTQRFVFLDETACSEFLPKFLTPRPATILTSGEWVLSEESFRTSLVPLLLKIFTIRETYVRLVLLENFKSYCRCIGEEDLKTFVLDELLLSSRESDDKLVEHSLIALSCLVPILGGNVVMGSRRTKYFFDGNVKQQPLKPCMDPGVDNLQEVLNKTKNSKKHNHRQQHLQLHQQRHYNKLNVNSKECSADISAVPNENTVNQTLTDLTANTNTNTTTTNNDLIINNNDIDSITITANNNTDVDKQQHKYLQRPIAIIEPKTNYHKPTLKELISIKNDCEDDDDKNDRKEDTDTDDDAYQNITDNMNTNSPSTNIKTEIFIIPYSLTGHTDKNRSINPSDRTKPSQNFQLPRNNGGAMKLTTTSQPPHNPSNKSSTTTIETLVQQSPSKNIQSPATPTQKNIEIKFDEEKNQMMGNIADKTNSAWEDMWESVDEPEDMKKNQLILPKITKSETITSASSRKQQQTSASSAITPTSRAPTSTSIKQTDKNTNFLKVKHAMDQPLGYGYDIKMVEIKKKTPENDAKNDDFDLFSELIPNIDFRKSEILIENSLNRKSSTTGLPTNSTRDITPTSANSNLNYDAINYSPDSIYSNNNNNNNNNNNCNKYNNNNNNDIVTAASPTTNYKLFQRTDNDWGDWNNDDDDIML